MTAAVDLLDGGATVPFIARYRKEATGELDDIQLRTLEERLRYLRELEERRAAIEEFRRDALLARAFGFVGKWTGIPEQTALAVEVFQIPDEEIARAVEEARLFAQVEAEGRGAAMIGGKMADRATDRINRVTLKTAYALGRLDEALAREIGIV